MGEETAGPNQIGRYELHSVLGQGGMGTVYKGRDPLMQRWVAVKTLLVRDAQQRSRFQREVQAAGGLNHPHITAVYDVGEAGELAYIVMELVEGETLAHRLAAPVPWREAINLLLPVVEGLGYAHRQGVVHRDVKPANILISQDEVVKLTDFGVARLEAALRRITESGSTVGTPLYMAPEQIRNEVVDGRADLFSVGIVLFELIAGRHPFSGDTLAQIVYRITQAETVDLEPLNPLAPPALIEVIGRSLSKTPETRFARAEAMSEALAACLDQTRPVSSPANTPPPKHPFPGNGSPSQPVIDIVASNISLTLAEEQLLLAAFKGYDRLFLERELGGGYSGARVLLVTPVRSGRRLAQVVLKLDAPAQVEREWQAYKEYVERTLPPVTARILEAPLYAEDRQLGLMHYTFAGGHGHTPPESLRHYYSHQSGEAVANILERSVFRAFGPKWWLQRRAASLIIRRAYDRLLPVHLMIAYREADEATLTPHQLIAGQTTAHTCAQLAVNQVVQLQDFTVEEIKPEQRELTLQALPPSGSATNPIRVRLVEGPADGLPYIVGQVVPTLVGVVTGTRDDLLRQRVEPLLPGQDLARPQVTLDGHILPNPLHDYETLLDQRISAMTSIVHGDLNLENILVNPTSGLAWLIDFATTGEGHNLTDFMRLETQVITKLLPQTGLGPAAAVQLMLALHQAEPTDRRLPTDLRKPFSVLIAIRRLVRICLYNRENWDEYYLGLVLTLLGALKFKELDVSARAMALAAAATVRGLITNPPPPVVPMPASSAPTPLPVWLRSNVAIGIAVGVVVLLLLLGLGLWLSGVLAPAEREPALSVTPVINVPVTTPTSQVALATPTSLPSPTPPSPATSGSGIVLRAVDIYSGPGLNYASRASVPAGNAVQIIGRSLDNAWWQISDPSEPGGHGWVLAKFVEPDEGVTVPVVPAPPTPTGTPPVSPTPTETPAVSVASTATTCPPPTFFRAAADLGCAVEAWRSDFTWQQFERGVMVWRKIPQPAQIYVLIETGRWRGQTDPEGPAHPSCVEAQQTGDLGPILSFGLIWCQEEMDRLGLPLSKESAVENSPVEQFERGLAFRLGQTDFVLLEDGQWESLTQTGREVDSSSSQIIEDFEPYTTATLRQTYTLNNAWDKNQITIDLVELAGAAHQGQVMALTYDIKAASPDNYVGLERNLSPAQDWSTAQALQLWVRNDSSLKELILQWGEAPGSGGEVWKSGVLLQPDESRTLDFPLDGQRFSRAEWSPPGNGQMDLTQVSYLAVFIDSTSPSSGTIFLDSLALLGQTSDCQAVDPAFQTLSGRFATELGCPTNTAHTIPFLVSETFEGGHLIWRDDTNEVYQIYDRAKNGAELFAGEWNAPPWQWDGIAGCPEAYQPPAGLRVPERGFGWLWCTHLGGPEGPLGWALTKEMPGEGRAQPFERGLAFQAEGLPVYALLANGQFLTADNSPGQTAPVPPARNQDTGFQPAGIFAQPWEELSQGEGPLGYPLGAAITRRNYAWQSFEGGLMVWWEALEDPQPIWVIYTPDPLAAQGDSWTRYDNIWQPEQPEYPPACPAAGPPLGPKNGFGLVWCHQPEVKRRLGQPKELEFGSGNVFPSGAVQFFQGGVMIEIPAERRILALSDNGGWYRFTY